MKRYIFIMSAALCLAACNQNEPTDTKKGGDNTYLNQPSYPSTWSPVGHKYVSTDEDPVYGHYGNEITFLSKDSFLWQREGDVKVVPYKLQYPTIYVWEDLYPWLKFVDTLTITKYASMEDESSKYELVY